MFAYEACEGNDGINVMEEKAISKLNENLVKAKTIRAQQNTQHEGIGIETDISLY